MKVWLLLCLLRCFLFLNTSQSQTPLRGDVRVIRTHLLAGRIEVYVREEWRAVCHSSWDDNDAQVVCRQLGFSDIGAESCRQSCFGNSLLPTGFFNFTCNGNETRLIDCPRRNATRGCVHDAGVICRDVITTTSSPIQCIPVVTTITQEVTGTLTQQITSTVTQPVTSTVAQQVTSTVTQQVTSTVTQQVTSTVTQQGQCTPVVTTISRQVTATQQGQCTPVTTTIMQQTFTGTVQEARKEDTSCTALGGGLGGLTALMTLLLVLVVLGWVCVCYRRRKYSVKESYNATFHNPVYDTTTPDPSNQYSLNGLQDKLSPTTKESYNATSGGEDYIQEVGGVGPHPTYDVIVTGKISIDHEEDDHTEEEVPHYSVLAHTDEEKRALYSVIAKPKKEDEHTDEVLTANSQDMSTSTEYSKLHYNY